jgi:predicted DCC family thiol-disulfide oxidoreductase YuxK
MSSTNPDTRVIVYDGHCYLCSGWARFHARHPTVPPFSLVAMQSDNGRALLSANGIDPADPATFLVIDRGRCMTDSDAAIHVVTALGGAWKSVEIVRILPRAWRDAAYRLVARNRYRWFGKRTTCYLPP